MAHIPVTPYTAKLIIQYTREMREAQRCFFRTKGNSYLVLARRYETKLDKLLALVDDTYIFEKKELKEYLESILSEAMK